MLLKVRRMLPLSLLMMVSTSKGFTQVLSPHPTATLAVNGGENTVNSAWDSGAITVDFNGYVERVSYGQFSSPASLASGLAALFCRDYIALGLYAKAGANGNQDPSVITFQLVNGAQFGPVSVSGPSTSFTFAPAGFSSASPVGADQGIATLTINGQPIATSNYGAGSTGATIAQDLALSATSSLVTVTAQGTQLFLQAKQASGSFSYPYSLTFSTNASFSPSSGVVSSTTDAAPVSVYSLAEVYDYVGNVVGVADSVMGMSAYGYDGLNRLTSDQISAAASGPYAGQNTCWSYDSFGNRTHQSFSNQPFVNSLGQPCQAAPGASLIDTAASYSTNNQISSLSTVSTAVVYDAAGNITYDGHTTYLYDAEGRVCAVHGTDGMTGYQYNADGQRIGKGVITSMSCDLTANGYTPTTDYVLDQGGGQMTEVSVGAAPGWQHTNVTANGSLIATYDTAGLHFYLNDALNSRRVQTDAAGFPEQSCQSLPFGDQLYCTGGSLSSPTEHHFTGKERDTESGLDYFGARYYASNMGRFSSPDDPFFSGSPGNPQSWNLYSYVQNNPLNNIDPDGHDCVTDNGNGSATINSGDCSGKNPNNEYYYNCDGCLMGTTSANITENGSLALFDASTNTVSTIASYGNQSYGPLDGPASQAGMALIGGWAGPVNAVAGVELTFIDPFAMGLAQCSMPGSSRGGCAGNMALVLLPELAALKEGGPVLKAAALTGKGAEIIQKAGGAAEATKAFEALPAVSEQVDGLVRVKTLSDGTKAVLYISSSGSEPTISIQTAAGQTLSKIRY